MIILKKKFAEKKKELVFLQKKKTLTKPSKSKFKINNHFRIGLNEIQIKCITVELGSTSLQQFVG